MCVGVSVCMRVCVRECVWCCLPNRPQIYLTLHPISVAWQSVTGVRWNSKQRSCISEFFFTTRICKRVSWCLYMNDLLLWCWMSILLMAGNVSTLIQRIVLFHVILQMGKTSIVKRQALITQTMNTWIVSPAPNGTREAILFFSSGLSTPVLHNWSLRPL